MSCVLTVNSRETFDKKKQNRAVGTNPGEKKGK